MFQLTSLFTCAGTLLSLCPGPQAHDLVALSLDPAFQVRVVDDVVEVDLIASSEGVDPQPFAALDAILSWDTSKLDLLGHDDTDAPYDWFLTGFLPDPDGINDDVSDGDALFTALSLPATPAFAPSAGLVVTTLRFRAVGKTVGTTIAFTPSMGVFGKTRVIDFFSPGVEITGDISSTATIVIEPPPTNYCSKTPNSADPDGADIMATGSSSHGAPQPSLQLAAFFVPNNNFGLFFHGAIQSKVPFGNGFLCVSGSLVRLNPPQMAPTGIAQRFVNVPAIPVGTRNFQYWFRDPAAGGAFYNLSDAVAVSIIP